MSIPELVRAPDSFSVMAIMPVYNEADILAVMLRHLTERGIAVHVLDNWSGDGSYEIALNASWWVTVERWPAEGPQEKFDWDGLCLYAGHLASNVLQADWFILHGADQFVEGPNERRDIRQAIWEVDRAGYNAINFTMHEYYPTNDDFRAGVDDPVEYFTAYKAYGRDVLPVTDAWKKVSPIDVSHWGGHLVHFEGRRVFPVDFIKRHYRIRSQAHGERKVFQERLPRYRDKELALGWHVHYRGLQPGHQFVADSGWWK